MSAVSACPDADRLQQFVLGLLPEPDSLALEGHVSGCEHCAHTVQKLPGEDTFVSALRSRAASAGLPAGAAVEDLMKRLRGLRAADPGPEDTAAEGMPTPQPVEIGGTPADRDVTEEISDLLGPAQGADEIGRLGGYRVLRMLGAGGMGVVFQAEDVALLRPVALKVMRPRLALDPQARERFLREARAAAKIKSDHVVTIYQVGEDRGAPFLAMEFLPGEPMDKWLKRGRKPNAAQLLRLTREMALGLAAAHERGLIHRDVKPGNVWLEAPAGRVKLLDFGLARPVKEDTHLTQSGVIVGTPAYMAPEQARGQKVDHRADLFSLGCVLYRLCTGRVPFTGDNVMAVLMALATDTPRPVRELNPDVPERFADLVTRLLAKDPAGRPASANAVVAEVQAFERARAAPAQPSALSVPVAPPVRQAEPESDPWADLTMPQSSEAPAPARPAAPAAAPPQRPRRRWPFAVAAGVLLALLAGAAAVYELTFKTPDGNLVVQIDDKDVEARFKDGELRLYDADGQLKYTLKPGEKDRALPPGEYRIAVTGADGLKLDTDKFEMRKNGKVTVRVLFEPKAVAGKKDGPTADPDRRVAEWVLKNGGGVCVGVGAEAHWVNGDAGKLPAGRLRLLVITLPAPSTKLDNLLENVRGLTELAQLDLRGMSLGDADLDRLASVPALENNLEYLLVGADRAQITDAGLVHLKRFRNLHNLVLHCPEMTDAGLAHLRELKLHTLELVSKNITGAGLAHLRGLPLNTLMLRDCPVGDAGLEHLKTLPELNQLTLDQLKVTDAGLATLAALPKLTSLDLSRLPITDDGLARLKGMLRLHQLALRQTKVTDAGLVHLAGLKDLEGLSIVTAPVTDAGLEPLKGLTHLQGLHLLETKVTAAGVKKLAAALPGCTIASDFGPFGPADALRREAIPAYELAAAGGGDPAKAPPELAAVLGDSRLQGWNYVWGTVFSPDGKQLLSFGNDSVVRVWDVATGRQLHALPLDAPRTLAVGKDGRTLAVGYEDGPVQLWDITTSQKLSTVAEKVRMPLLAINPATAALTYASDKTVTLGSGKDTRTLDCPSPVKAVGYNGDGTVLAVGMESGAVQLWEAATGKAGRAFTLPGAATGVALSPDGKTVAAAGAGNRLKVWDAVTGEELYEHKFVNSAAHSLVFSADGRTLTVPDLGKVVRWTRGQGAVTVKLSPPWEAQDWQSWNGTLSPDGKLLAVVGKGGHQVALLDTTTGKELFPDRPGMVTRVAFSADGRLLASFGGGGKARIWDTATGKQRAAASLGGVAFYLKFNGDNTALHVGGWILKNWTFTKNGPPLEPWSAGDRQPFCAAMSPNYVLQATGFARPEGGLEVFDFSAGKARTFKGHEKLVIGVAFSPDGKLLASAGGDKTVKLWDVAGGKELATLPADLAPYDVVPLAFSPDGKVLALAGGDGLLRLWAVPSGQELGTLRGHRSGAYSVAFSPDGRTLASSANDGTVRLWDWARGEEKKVWQLGPALGAIRQIAFSPDGRHLATANGNGTIYVLRLPAPPAAGGAKE